MSERVPGQVQEVPMGRKARLKRARRTVARFVARHAAIALGEQVPRGVNDHAPAGACLRVLRDRVRSGDLVLRQVGAT